MDGPAIAVVGTGIVTAAGRGPAATLRALASGGRDPAAPRTIRSDLAERHPVFEVDDAVLEGGGARLPGGRGRRSLRLALVAASDAVAAARALRVDPARVGVIVGATVGGMNHGEDWIEAVHRGADDGPRPAVAARPAIRHVALWEIPAAIARRFGFGGPAFAVTTACTSGTQAIAAAADLVASGACDAVLAGGVDCLARLTYHGFASLGVLAPRRCTPFAAGRAGLNLGEGAAFALLVRDDAAGAAAGGAPRLTGWACNTDGHHATAPRPDGSGVAAALRAALGVAGVAPSEVGWVHAHGTGTPTNDAVESAAVRAVFGAHRVPVSSTKHVTGHTLGAAGAVATVASVVALREGFVPGNAAAPARDPACDVDLVPPEGLRAAPRHVVVGSLGFGGASCALVLSEASA